MKVQATLCAVLAGSAAAFAPASIPSRSSTALDLAVGETAPEFSLVDQNGKTVTRSKINKPLVVYFYPADSTPGCTTQANSFNDKVQDLRKQFGAELVGISGQGVESKQKFASELGLSFSILADEGDAVRSSFGVPKAAFGLFPGRVTYVLDKKGVCQKVYQELANAASHVDVAIAALEEMKPAAKSNNPLAALFQK
jgi:peroxiredoxin Q/BCP